MAMIDPEEPVRIPVTDVFDLHSVPPSDVRAVCELVRYFRDAPADAGGWGATIVTLR